MCKYASSLKKITYSKLNAYSKDGIGLMKENDGQQGDTAVYTATLKSIAETETGQLEL